MQPRGRGRAQQQILQLMTDGNPRSCGQINTEPQLQRIRSVRSAVCGLREQKWLCDIGERDHHGGHLWLITIAGQAAAPGHANPRHQKPRRPNRPHVGELIAARNHK